MCRATSGTLGPSDFPAHGLVRDGTPCGDNLVCVNQTCVSIYPHIDQTKCPTNSLNMECFGQGVSFLLILKLCVGINKIHLAQNGRLPNPSGRTTHPQPFYRAMTCLMYIWQNSSRISFTLCPNLSVRLFQHSFLISQSFDFVWLYVWEGGTF